MDQTLDNSHYEIIIVNDCSTDFTEKILENYESEVRVFNLKKNIGLSAARNFGIKQSKGQFVVFLDADDYFHKSLLVVEKLFLEENNKLDAVSVDYFQVDERGNHQKYFNAEKNPIACGIMFRKDLLYDVGLYDENFRAREEEELRVRFEKKYRIHNLSAPLYRYWIHEDNLTKNNVKMNHYKDKLIKKHGN
jgi:glycosyltransferase involved in cell wall biosynthesis